MSQSSPTGEAPLLSRWRQFLSAADRQLFRPAATLPAALHRRSRLLAGLLLAIFVLVGFALLVSYLANPAAELLPGIYLPVTAGGTLVLGLAFFLNRAGRYTQAAGLTIAIAALGVWSAILLNESTASLDSTLIPYVLLIVLLSSLLLSAWATAAIGAAQLAGLALLPQWLPDLPPTAFASLYVFISFITLLIVVSAMISQRAQADLDRQTRAHTESEAKFRLLFSASPDAVILIDPHDPTTPWSIVDCNDAAGQMNGYTRAELVGQSVDILNEKPGTAAERAAYLQRVRAAGTLHVEAMHRHKDGRLVAVEISTSLIRLGGQELLLGIDRDITARQQAAVELQAANTKLTQWLGELEERTRDIALLNELSEMLQACVSSEEAYNVIGKLGRQLFPAANGALCVRSASANTVERVSMWGAPEGGEVGEAVFAPEDCWGLRRGRLYASGADAPAPVCGHLGRTDAPAYLCVPLLANDGTVGLLHLQQADGRPVDDAHRRLAQTVADSVALALANLNLRETLRRQSIRDPLTGLFNRRYLEETLDREVRRVTRAQLPLGVIMLDIDHFKVFNDTFGHEAGDTVLREFGRFLLAQVRGEDIACRYGGEEFVVIMPEAGLDATYQRAEQLRAGVKHLNVTERGQGLGAINLSLGVALFPQHGANGEALLRAADAALYQAKHTNRDRVVVAD